MLKTHSVPEASSSTLPEVDVTQLDSVTGGGTKVLVPTEECPTCLSGADPKVNDARYEELLAGDL